MTWEHDLLVSLQSLRSPFMDWLMAFFSHMNDHGYLAIALAVVLILFRRTRRTGIEAAMAVVLAFILANLIIKNLVARPRPYETYGDIVSLVGLQKDTSFPSGHSVSAFAAATAVFLNNRKLGVVALVFAALIAFSRLYNQVHYPTDVLAGIMIGVGTALLVHFVLYGAFEKGINKLKKKA